MAKQQITQPETKTTSEKENNTNNTLTDEQKTLARYLYWQGDDAEASTEKAKDLTQTKTKKL